MRKFILLGSIAGLFVLGAPAVAGANQVNSGTDCNYARSQSQVVPPVDNASPVAQVFVYQGTGSTGNAGTSATGACVNVQGFGGFAEAGTDNTRGDYVVLDGSNNNPGQATGYMGISTYEDGTSKAPCPDPTGGTGGQPGTTNSGGCFSVKGTGVGVPIPVMCGFTSGPNWNSTPRDGCYIP
jgi:hypothetical protein